MNFFFVRNFKWCCQNWNAYRSFSTAAKHFKKEHPKSWISGKKTKEVHHIVPRHVCQEINRDDLIVDPRNFFPMAGRQEHLQYGHTGNWKAWNAKILATCHEIWAIGANDSPGWLWDNKLVDDLIRNEL